MARLFCLFAQNREASAGIEYGLIAFGIALAIVASLAGLGAESGFTTVDGTFH